MAVFSLGALLTSLQGCSGGFVDGLSGLFGKQEQAGTVPPSSETPAEATAKPTPYYVGANNLNIFDAPGGHSIGRLPLHSKVLRYQLEKGYAYVKVEATRQEGWVDNAKLVWRLTEPKAAAAKALNEPPRSGNPAEPSSSAPESVPPASHAAMGPGRSPPSSSDDARLEPPTAQKVAVPAKVEIRPPVPALPSVPVTPRQDATEDSKLNPSIFNPY